MAALRVRRTWWISQRPTPEVPLFRLLARRWRPVDRRERRAVPFQLALSAAETPPPGRASFGPQRPVEAGDAVTARKSTRVWNPWMLMK